MYKHLISFLTLTIIFSFSGLSYSQNKGTPISRRSEKDKKNVVDKKNNVKTTKDSTVVKTTKDSTVVKTTKDSTGVKTTKDSTAVKPVKQPAKVKTVNPEIKKPEIDKKVLVHNYHTDKLAPSEVPPVTNKDYIYENTFYKAILTPYGGTFKSFVLKNKKYKEKTVPQELLKQKKSTLKLIPIDMVKTWNPVFLPFVIEMDIEKQADSLKDHTFYYVKNSKNYRPLNQNWVLKNREETKSFTKIYLELKTQNLCTKEKLLKKENCFPAKLTKIYTFYPDSYEIGLDIYVENISNSLINMKKAVISISTLHEGEESRGFFNPVSNEKEAICYNSDGVKVQPYKIILHGKSKSSCMGGCGGGCSGAGCAGCSREPAGSSYFPSGARWAGIDAKKYFLMAIIKNYPADDGGCKFIAMPIKEREGYGLLFANLEFGERKNIKPGTKIVIPTKIYIGPKDIKHLEKVKIYPHIPKSGEAVNATKDSKLTKSVHFGMLAFIGKFMIWTLKFVQRFVGNWGLAIIFLTIFIKLFTLYFTTKSMRSMKKMASLKPQMDELQKKYKGNKDKLNSEVMALYKRNGVNPISGCLPMFLQMPIYIAWYQALMASVELYRAPLFGWINDLTARDPYFILPLFMGITMFIQQKISPSTGDNQQAKMMMYMMPIMFTGIMAFLPSGLTLYILTNTLLSLVHQWYMNHTPDAI
jgi:YidC/Oxa1 family membrane protein insertase